MASWKVSKTGKGDDFVSCTSPKPDDLVSCFEHIYFEGNLGSIITYHYASAEGRMERAKTGYHIRAVGKYKDVLIVVKRFENYFEPVDLNNPFNFPNLPNWVDRLKYVIHGIKNGQR